MIKSTLLCIRRSIEHLLSLLAAFSFGRAGFGEGEGEQLIELRLQKREIKINHRKSICSWGGFPKQHRQRRLGRQLLNLHLLLGAHLESPFYTLHSALHSSFILSLIVINPPVYVRRIPQPRLRSLPPAQHQRPFPLRPKVERSLKATHHHREGGGVAGDGRGMQTHHCNAYIPRIILTTERLRFLAHIAGWVGGGIQTDRAAYYVTHPHLRPFQSQVFQDPPV